MVAHSGTALRADRLRPLNRPRPIRVETDERGYPIGVSFGRKAEGISVVEIMDRWRIDDEWWRCTGEGLRTEVSRMYYHVRLANRRLIVLFHDLIGGKWFAQTTATPLEKEEPVHVFTPRVAAAAESQKATIRSVGSGVA